MSPRRKPAFQDFQDFSEPVPYQREGDFQRGGGRWGSEPVPKGALGLRACPQREEEPVPYQGAQSLSLIREFSEGACPLLDYTDSGRSF
jgi:hypothetical protein